MKKCVFIGGKQIGVNCLKTLLKKGIKPSLVISNIDDTGKDTWYESLVKLAKAENLNTLKNTKVKEPEAIKQIQDIQPEIIFCIGGMQIIPKEVLNLPKLGCLNIHPALLPKYRGRYSTAHAIFNEEEYAGATVHWMDRGIDSGPIILQKKIKIEENDTAKTLYNKFTDTGTMLFEQFVNMWLKNEKIPNTPQNETHATYYPKGLPNNGEIDWSWDGKKIRNFIRAMTFEPFLPPEFTIGDKKMVIIDKKYFKSYE